MNVKLTWTDNNTNETGHRIYRSSSPMDTQALPPPVAELGADVTEWEDTGTPVDQETYYIVSAVRGADEAFSDEVMIDTTSTEEDPYWDKVVALLRFDGDLMDEKGLVWNRDPSLTTFEVIQPIFGSASLRSLGKGLGVYRSNPINDTTAEFTIEGFIRVESLLPPAPNGAVRTALYGQPQNTSNGEFGLYFQHSPTPLVGLDLRGGAANLVFTSTEFVAVLGRTYHFAHTYDGAAHRVFIDGVMIIETAQSFGWKNTNQPFRVGAIYLPSYATSRIGADALFDEFRITKGVARYTENFTPSTGPFPNQ